MEKRVFFAREGLSDLDFALEISPLHAMLLLPGPRTFVLDVKSRDEHVKELSAAAENNWLLKQYGPLWENLIPNTSFIWKGQSYKDLVGDLAFNRIVASHVIEHIPDVISWLNWIHEILLPGGQLRLFVPDMRFTWDHNRTPTRLLDILDNHLERRDRPSWGMILEQILYSPRAKSAQELLNASFTPQQRSLENTFDPSLIMRAYAEIVRMKNISKYVDAHVSKWHQKSFKSHFNCLYLMKLTRMKLVYTSRQHGHATEFSAIFERD